MRRSARIQHGVLVGVGLGLALMAACGDGEKGSADAVDATLVDAAADAAQDAAATDTVSGDGPTVDVVLVDADWADVPPATPKLHAGASFKSFRFPVGVPTVGYAPGSGPKTRFADMYPGTDAQHTDLGAKALVLRAGGKALVFVRLDLIGLWDTNRDEVGATLRAQGRGDLADGLILSATHTHSSGGRLMDHPIIQIAVDTFVPGLYGRVRDAMVDAVLAADAAAMPARVGWTTLRVPSLHSDRRCENGPIQDDSLGLVKVESAADGKLLAVLANYAMHGTVLGGEENTLSSDAPGAFEYGIESRLPDAAMVLFVQSWAGDMAPKTPHELATVAGFDVRDAYRDLDAIGSAAAGIVIPALGAITTDDEPVLDVETLRFPISGKLANPDGSFDDYPYGALYCFSTEENCPESGGKPYTDLGCFPFDEDVTIHSAQVTAARIGDLGFVTLPGEPLTSIGLELRDRALEKTGLKQVFVLGYSQGYLSYLLHPDDFWMGGYEGASALMGPGGGQYLVDMSVLAAERMMNPDSVLPFTPVKFDWGPVVDYAPLDVEPALGAASITAQPTSDGGQRVVTWVGGDPAADQPVVIVERETSGAFAPVVAPNGRTLTSRGPEIELRLVVAPGYTSAAAGTPRTFTWTARLPTLFSVPSSWGDLHGTFRFRIQGTRPDAYDLVSDSFTM